MRGRHERPCQADTSRGHLRALGNLATGRRTRAGHAEATGWFVNRNRKVAPHDPDSPARGSADQPESTFTTALGLAEFASKIIPNPNC